MIDKILCPLRAHILLGVQKKTNKTEKHNTAQNSTAQHSTAQHSTAQHSTAQHSTAQSNYVVFYNFITTTKRQYYPRG